MSWEGFLVSFVLNSRYVVVKTTDGCETGFVQFFLSKDLLCMQVNLQLMKNTALSAHCLLLVVSLAKQSGQLSVQAKGMKHTTKRKKVVTSKNNFAI